MDHNIFVVFGSASTIRDGGHEVKEFKFETKEELNAFILGIQEATGWSDLHVASSRKDINAYIEECIN